MRKLLVLVIIGCAAWYGWRHWTELRQPPRDEAVVENQSGHDISRVRLDVGGQTFVRESLPDGQSASFPFHVDGDAAFTLRWQNAREDVDRTWSGGEVTAGPLRTRHHIQVQGDGGVVCSTEHIASDKPAASGGESR